MTLSSTYDLLQDAIRKKAFSGESDRNIVLQVEQPGFERYRFKVSATGKLDRNTNLTPLDYNMRYNFGQPLLADRRMQVMHDVPGKSLNVIEAEKRRALQAAGQLQWEAERDARASLMEEIASLPSHTYSRWMRDRQYQLQHGAGGDNIDANVQYDKERESLKDLDVVEDGKRFWDRHNVRDITNGIWETLVGKRQVEASKVIRRKVSAAAQEFMIPETRNGFWGRKAPVFAKIDLTSQFGTFNITSVPEKLLELLEAMNHGYPIR